MNREKIWYARALLVTQINHWALFPVLMLFFGMVENIRSFDAPSPLLWLELGILPAVLTVFRSRIRHFGILLISHGAAAALFAAFLVLESRSSGWVYALVAVCYAVCSIFHRLNREDAQDGKIHILAAAGISAASLWIQHFQGCTEWDFWYAAALIAVAAMYYLSVYLERYLNFLAVNESSTGHIPEREIFASGSRLAICYVLFSVFVLFLTSGFERLRPILSALRGLLIALLRKLLSGGAGQGQELPEAGPVEPSGGGSMVLPEAGEPFFLWKLLEAVLEAAVFCGLICLAVWLLLRLIAWIRERMGNLQAFQTGTNEDGTRDVRERCVIEKPVKRAVRGKPFAFLSAQERIRRLYQMHILSSGSAQKPSESEKAGLALLTAREWEECLEQKGLAAPYEKARYSGETCTAEDVRAMKAACRNQKMLSD